MKKTILLLAGLAMTAISCNSSDDNAPVVIPVAANPTIYGWWYRNANTRTDSYKAYYFGEDGVYKQDGSNYGIPMGTGTYTLIGTDSVRIVPNANGGIQGGPAKGKIFKLTADSLVIYSQSLRLSKNNPN